MKFIIGKKVNVRGKQGTDVREAAIFTLYTPLFSLVQPVIEALMGEELTDIYHIHNCGVGVGKKSIPSLGLGVHVQEMTLPEGYRVVPSANC